jgi:DNA-binding response OmpR family regulator
MRILIVDDEPNVADHLSHMLRRPRITDEQTFSRTGTDNGV